MLNMNLFGVSMVGSSICGYQGRVDEELCIRWYQLGAFYPLSVYFRPKMDATDSFALFKPTIRRHTQDALRLRYRLISYLRTLQHDQRETGNPIVRSLMMEYPSDPIARSIDTQFMWGAWLMVLPVLKAQSFTDKYYFPKGIWYNAYDLSKLLVSRGRYFSLRTPLKTIPVCVRGGAVLPYHEYDPDFQKLRKSPLHIVVFPNQDQKAKGSIVKEQFGAVRRTTLISFEYKRVSCLLFKSFVKATLTRFLSSSTSSYG
jgi:alpha-glucosidase (family GH31 glycosyl hydrolase)